MLQSHIIEVDGVFVGAAIRIDRGYRFVATDFRLEELEFLHLANAGGRPPPRAPRTSRRDPSPPDRPGRPCNRSSASRQGPLNHDNSHPPRHVARCVAAPVNRQPGQDVIIPPAVSDEVARQQFPNGWSTVKPCLRVVAQPRD